MTLSSALSDPPAARKTTQPIPRDEPARPCVAPRSRVLVVDDDSVVRRLLRRDLERDGYEVRTAGDGGQTLIESCAWEPDLIVLDICLEHENGLDLLRRITQLQPHVPVVLHSNYPGYCDDFTSWLASAFLPKMRDTTRLRSTVRELLGAVASP